MDDAFQLADPQDALDYLKGFSAEARRKGEACFAAGQVRKLVPEEPGELFLAEVEENGALFEVELEYIADEGWMGGCTCEEGIDCEHVFAAMRLLLAENNAATVRRLSAGQVPGGEAAAKPAKPPEALAGPDVAQRLMTALGRPLKAPESKFVRSLKEAYNRCRQTRQISFWEFHQLGLPLPGFGWGGMQIWPSFPKSEYEFWLYVANAVLSQGGKIPAFMEPITDLSPVQEELARWKRSREVERWKQSFAHLPVGPAPAAAEAKAETDLRLRIAGNEAVLQWLRPGQTEFEPVKYTHVRQLASDYDSGRVQFTSEAALIWQFFSHRVNYGLAASLRLQDSEAGPLVGRLLRLRMLDSRIVGRTGEPLARPAEPLRWEIIPAEGEDDDYRLHLVKSDGTPAPEILTILPGSPTLYLAADAVYAGPPQRYHLLDPAKENRIPAPAIESAPGVTFLQALSVELPPRLRERVRLLPYDVVLRFELRPSPYRPDTEECALSATAEAPDGHCQRWTGYNWLDCTPKGGRGRRQDGNEILLYDAGMLLRTQELLDPLPLKGAPDGTLAMKVTKKFPETFSGWLKSLPPQITVQLMGDLASFQAEAVAGRVRLDISEAEIDWFDLRVVLDVSDTTLTPEEIKLLLNAKGNFVRLQGKGWRRLQFDLSEEENDHLARLGLSPRELSDQPQRLHALQLADESAKKFLPEPQVEQIQRRADEIKARVAPPLPAGVRAELRPYQLEGFHFLAYLAANRFGGILADDMGLGKTLQALAWLLWLREEATRPARPEPPENGEPSSQAAAPDLPPVFSAPALPRVGPSLVVCPKSVMDNWQAEAERFTPELRVRVWNPSELENFSRELDSADLHVINYAQLRLLGEGLVSVRWLAIILDEGQYIKNPNSQTAQAARALRGEHRLVLSGTPIENRLLDLWSLMAFAMPGLLGSRAHFARLYDAKGDPLARRRLASRIRPFLLRRTKAQVAKDLPDRIEEDLFCEIEGEQKTLYRAELKRAQQLLLKIKTQKELAQQQFHFLVSLLRLRQICCHPSLMKPDSKAPSAKTEALLEQLEPLMEEGNKVLVFSQFVEMLELLRAPLEERGWPIFYLTGETENRGDLVRQFQSAEGPAIFLISLKAGGFGLNLTAASYVVLFDPWWNPAVENQAIDRTHRIGQTNKVIAYRLLIKNSIEEKIRQLQKQKQALAEDVLGEERFAQSLTLQDLQFLFAD